MPYDQSFHEIYELHADAILAITYTYVKDWGVAEDITQEVFMNYWQKATQFRGDSSIKTYLTRAAINRAKDYLKSWRYRTHRLTSHFSVKAHNHSTLLVNEEYTELAESIFNLPVDFREIIILYFYQQYTYKEIAELLKMPESTLKNRMIKAKKLLKAQLPNESWEVLMYDGH